MSLRALARASRTNKPAAAATLAMRPEPPIALVGAARARWDECVGKRRFEDRELATLAAYCAAYGRWIEAEEWLANPDHGRVITIWDDKGNIKSHGPAPQLTIAERASREAQRLAFVLML